MSSPGPWAPPERKHDWRAFLTEEEQRAIAEADAAKAKWQQLNTERAKITNRAIQRAKAAAGAPRSTREGGAVGEAVDLFKREHRKLWGAGAPDAVTAYPKTAAELDRLTQALAEARLEARQWFEAFDRSLDDVAALRQQAAEAQARLGEVTRERDGLRAELDDRDEERADYHEAAVARDGAGFLGSVAGCIEWLASDLKTAEADARRLRAALTPSAETKAAYIGEFSFKVEREAYDEDGEDISFTETLTVPWDTVKQIMAAVRAYAAALSQPPAGAPVQPSGNPDDHEERP